MAATSILSVILPKKKSNPTGVTVDPVYNPASPTTALAIPQYNDHLTDIFTSRSTDSSLVLLQNLFKSDPDVSASVNAYLNVASSAEPWYVVYDQTGAVDPAGHDSLYTILQALFTKNDYSVGFQMKSTMGQFLQELRYMALLRGAVGGELVLDKTLLPSQIRQVDFTTLKWYEQVPGNPKPTQRVSGSSTETSLDTPLFFVSYYNKDPTAIYSYSPFVSSINTIAARQQVINDLYRIMRKTGYPRQSIKVIEDVLRKNAPADAQNDASLMNTWLTARMTEIASSVSSLSADQVYVHSDSIEPGMLNEKSPGMEMNVTPIIDVLNAQNQAALKTMATIIGRGESGVNTASVESRLFSMHADALNAPIAAMMSDILTLCLRLTGSQSVVEFGFDKVELRPELELEPMKLMRQNRLLTLLSLGIITDDDFHIELFSHPKPTAAPTLSGTGFFAGSLANTGAETPPQAADPVNNAKQQSDPVARQAKVPGGDTANSSQITRKKASPQ